MHKLKVRANHTVYIIFAVLSLFSLTLIFNDNIWFDEAYTLSLIQHNYSDIINILKSDMHPPLYFLSLKTFCCIFGYSITATKIFSAIGYIATLFLGCTIIKKHYGSKTSIIYMLTVGAVPMMLYFSVQQRSYSWSIFFVTLCFIESLLFIANKKFHHCILFAIAGLGAAYNTSTHFLQLQLSLLLQIYICSLKAEICSSVLLLQTLLWWQDIHFG